MNTNPFKFLMLLIALVSSAGAFAEVNVSRVFSTHEFAETVNVGPGKLWVYPLLAGDAGDVFQIQINTSNAVWRDISVHVLDEANLLKLKAGVPFQGQGRVKGLTPFGFEATRTNLQPHYLVLDNGYAAVITKKVVVKIKITGRFPEDRAKQTEELWKKLYSHLKETFVFADFDINVRPCGQVNASSARKTGDITFCSELVSKYMNNPSVIEFVFFHELGHTMLELWGLPGADNEDMADEFATNLLIQSKDGAKTVTDALDFFKDDNPYLQAQYAIEKGNRHSLSVQRIRNIREQLIHPKAISAKWNRLLYPHLTDLALNKIVDSPDGFADVAMAKAELAKRDGNVSFSADNTSSVSAMPVLGCSKDIECKGDRICERGVCVAPSSE